MALSIQIIHLFLIALPIACVSWTVTKEEIFAEPRNYCVKNSKKCENIVKRKFFYLFTCEYCFSHYVTLAFLVITNFTLIFEGWRGYLIGFFALVWIANLYMSIFAFIRIGMKHEKIEADIKEITLESIKDDC